MAQVAATVVITSTVYAVLVVGTVNMIAVMCV
jgi:hypothetical protein